MPPKVKITKEMILETAFSLVRESGPDGISARAISEKLGCSTQPILYNFRTVEEIRQETYRMADEYHSAFIMPRGDANPLLELGLNYIRFAHEEPNLFRFLFQINQFAGNNLEQMMSVPELREILGMISAKAGCGANAAKELFLSMFVAAHGCASLLANNAMEYDEAVFRKILNQSFAVFDGKDGGNNEKTV